MNQNNAASLHFGDKECRILPYENPAPPENLNHYKKLELSPTQQKRMKEFVEQMSAATQNEKSNQPYYVVRWPDGLPSGLTPFIVGSNAISVLANAGGAIAAQSGLPYSLIQAGFSLLSVIAQFFLWGANQELTVISQKIDDILDFLYGDKKAELISAISFTRYAYENFSSIMEHEGQRNATIQSLQSARMTAMQDVEFYLSDLNTAVQKNERLPEKIDDMKKVTSKVLQSSECLDLSVQLCMTTNLLEIYYSQNNDPKYLRYVENDVGNYISRCEKQRIDNFSALKNSLKSRYRKTPDWDKDKRKKIESMVEQVDEKLEHFKSDGGDKLKARLKKALRSLEQETECCIGVDGAAYLKIEA